MARTQTRGLGRGLDALLGAPEVTAAAPAPATATVAAAGEGAARDADTDVEQAVAAVVAQAAQAAQASTMPKTNPATAPALSAEPIITTRPAATAESIDVHFSMSDPEVTQRAPRKLGASPAQAKAADAKTAPQAASAAPTKAAAPAAAPTPAPAPQEPQPVAIPDGSIAEIALEFIEVNPYQPRLRFKQEPLDELAASIARDGLLQPITVRPLPSGKFQIISGERRFRASQIAGIRSIPAYIREAPDREMGKYALIENLQRENLNPIEAAVGYRNLMTSQNLTQNDVAQLLCKGRSTIANTLRLLDLPEDLQEMIYTDQLTEGHARAIQSVPTPEGRRKLADKVIAEGLSVRATENLARFMTGRQTAADGEKAERATVPAAYKAVARALKQHLGAAVKVKNAGGKNKIEIEFADGDDLERICAQIMGERAREAGE